MSKLCLKFSKFEQCPCPSQEAGSGAVGLAASVQAFPTPFGVPKRFERPLTCVWVQLSDAVLRASLQPDPSYTRCENLWSCSSAVSQRVWKSGGPATAPLLCNVLCATSTFRVYAHVGVCTLQCIQKGTAGSRGNFCRGGPQHGRQAGGSVSFSFR